jgi:hypothetical protein
LICLLMLCNINFFSIILVNVIQTLPICQ